MRLKRNSKNYNDMEDVILEILKSKTQNLSKAHWNPSFGLSESDYKKVTNDIVKLINTDYFSAKLPSDDEIETAAINYRDESDNKYINEDTMMVEVHWYDKQEAFTAGVKWVLENY